MRRSSIKTGLINQRNRARLREKLDSRHRKHSFNDPQLQMKAWLEREMSSMDISETETLNLTNFIRNTGEIDLSPEERLRKLAIFIENDLIYFSQQPRGWLALDRVYRHAIKIAPLDASLQHSRGVSAISCAENLNPKTDASIFRRLLNVARASALEAHGLDPNDAGSQYLMGYICYLDPQSTIEEALQKFDNAISMDPEYLWALLYRAHCLHDLERWQEAYDAYSCTNPGLFIGSRAWRYELLLEQRAYCLLRSGDVNGASEEFKKLIRRWMNNPKVADYLVGLYIKEVAHGILKEQIGEEFLSLAKLEQWGWLNRE